MSAPPVSTVKHTGSCHCGAYLGPDKDTAVDCNCSICHMKRNTHVMVPEDKFTLLSGEDCITTYQFNTKVARHQFCKVCGVQSFYRPRSHPHAYAVTIYCVAPGTYTDIKVVNFDGQHWEEVIEESGIRKLASKPVADTEGV
ncbi:Mss4-like protein [Haematococcus lacustris]